MSIEGHIDPVDMKLVCVFKKEDSKEFLDFELNMLIENPLFDEKIENSDDTIYIFDFAIYKQDWFTFLLGKYSKLSNTLKKAIKNYYGETSNEYQYMDSYLNPKDYYSRYSDLLDVPVKDLEAIGELCDACDLEKETLKLPKEYLEELKK
jgi:hypothetical protein